VVPLRLVGIHEERRGVGVAARPHGALHEDVAALSRLQDVVAHRLDEGDGASVDVRELFALVAEQTSPVSVSPPRGCGEHERDVPVPGELEKRLVVAAQRGASVVAVDQRERRELRELETLVEDQDRLQSSVGQPHQTPTASRSISGAYIPVRAAEFIFARW